MPTYAETHASPFANWLHRLVSQDPFAFHISRPVASLNSARRRRPTEPLDRSSPRRRVIVISNPHASASQLHESYLNIIIAISGQPEINYFHELPVPNLTDIGWCRHLAHINPMALQLGMPPFTPSSRYSPSRYILITAHLVFFKSLRYYLIS